VASSWRRGRGAQPDASLARLTFRRHLARLVEPRHPARRWRIAPETELGRQGRSAGEAEAARSSPLQGQIGYGPPAATARKRPASATRRESESGAFCCNGSAKKASRIRRSGQWLGVVIASNQNSSAGQRPAPFHGDGFSDSELAVDQSLAFGAEAHC